MKAMIKGLVLQKTHTDNGKKGVEKKDYYKYLVFTGGADNAEVSCTNEEYAKIKENTQVEIPVNIMAVKRFDSANLYVKQIAV